ncbi:MAG: alkene reductase [Alphaproteobacteria bacterium]|nr:MAG: alkene reductase [Alphaproteobacteria bacterium]
MSALEQDAKSDASTDILLTPYKLNEKLTFPNRIVMAPMTRCVCDDDLVPTADMAAYYAKRANAGMIVSEAIIVHPRAQGYPNVPGIFTDAQIEGWRNVVEAVHSKGGIIFAQLWHTGRIATTVFTPNGEAPLAPSAIPAPGRVRRADGEVPHDTPDAMTIDQIHEMAEIYAQAAENAMKAGFDGVEIHGANGYLIDQFLHYDPNRRTDEYGGNPVNMARFCLEVVDAVLKRVDNNLVGLRLSPAGYAQMEEDDRDGEVFKYLLPELDKRKLAYVHGSIFVDQVAYPYLDDMPITGFIRKYYDGNTIGVGSYTPESAAPLIENTFDMIAIGRLYLTNADLAGKLARGEELNPIDDAATLNPD